MHLQVTFLSELTNNTGNRLSPSAFGENKRYRKRSNLQWSKQHNPDKQTWSVWKKMITTIYCGAKDSLFLRPTMRLGQWQCNHFQHTQIHPYLYSPSTMEIYQQKPQQTTQWFASTNNQEEIQIMLDSSTSCSTIPSDSYPIERKTKTNFRLFPNHAHIQCKRKTIQSWKEYIQQLDDWTKLLIQNHNFHQGAESLPLHITQQTNLIIATDGSKYEKRNGGSCIIALEDGTHIATGHNPNFGQANKTSSYRTEVYASLAVLLFLHHYAKYYKITLVTLV